MTDPPNVVFIVGDTLRRDRVACYGYEREVTPNIDTFAEQATRYTDAVTQASWSIPSHASMFTGRYPCEHGATTLSPMLRGGGTLAELLSRSGYRTCGVSNNEYIRPMTGFARGFDTFHPTQVDVPDWLVDLVGAGVNAICGSPRLRRPIEAVFNTVRRLGTDDGDGAQTPLEPAERFIRKRGEPFFLFLNLIDIHLPRSPDESFRRRFVEVDLADVTIPSNERTHNFGSEEMSPRQREKMSQLYDADVATMDARFGRLLAVLREEGVFENTLVVFVSDHGEHLGEFNRIGHQHSVYDSVVAVPLIIKYPGQTTDRRVDEQVEIRRLFHTVLDETGVRTAPQQSLETVDASTPSYGEFYTPMLDIAQLERNNRVVYKPQLLGQTLSFVRHGGYKLIRNAGEETLYRTPERPDTEIPIEDHQNLLERFDVVSPRPSPSPG